MPLVEILSPFVGVKHDAEPRNVVDNIFLAGSVNGIVLNVVLLTKEIFVVIA